MELAWSPSRMPKWNYIAGDLALDKTKIWEETISGKPKITNEEAKAFEKTKSEYIKQLTGAKSKEEIDDQKTRNVCSRCGKSGHMAFQCFNFLNKGQAVDPALNELIPSESESDDNSNKRSRSRSPRRHHKHHRHHSYRICI